MQPIQLGAPGPALSSTALTRAVASPGGASTPPLTPRTLQHRLREASERMNGVLRDTSDVNTCLAAQDARLFPLNGMLETGPAGASFSGARLERLRQHVSELRSQLDKGGSKEPTTVQHVQRMLGILAGYANSVDDPDSTARRELVESIESLRGEVTQLNDLAARGERAAGEVVEVRRTLEDLQVDVTSQIGTPRTPTRSKACSPARQQPLQDLRRELTGAVEAVRDQVSEYGVQELRTAVAEVRAQISELTEGLAEMRVRTTDRAVTSKAGLQDVAGASDFAADVAQVKRDMSKTEREMHRRLKDLQSDCASLRGEAAELAASTQRDLAELRQRLAATPARAISPRSGTTSPRMEALGHEGETLIVLKQLIRNSQRDTNDAMDELRGQVQQVTACSSEVALQVAASTKDSANLRKELTSLALELRSSCRGPLQDESNFVTSQQLEDALQGLQHRLGASVRRASQVQLEETAEALRQQLSVELTSEKCLAAATPENGVTHEQLEASIEIVRAEFKRGLEALKDNHIESLVISMRRSIADEHDSRVVLQEVVAELRKQCDRLQHELGAAMKQACGNGEAPAELAVVKKDVKRLFSQVEILKSHIDDADVSNSARGAAGPETDGKALAELTECRKDMTRLWKQVGILKTALDERADELKEEVIANILERMGSTAQSCSPHKGQNPTPAPPAVVVHRPQ